MRSITFITPPADDCQRSIPRTGRLSPNPNDPTNHIVDVTDQHVDKSVIITGVEPPKKFAAAEREEKLRGHMESINKAPKK
jgi:hypothetical protein